MAVWQFNRGEWTEAYVFMRLLGDGRIYGASSELTKDDSTYIDIINIIRDEPDKMLIFERFVDANTAYIKASKDGESIKVVTAPEFSEYAQVLYDNIKTLTANRVTSVTEVQEYLESLGIDTPKANLSDSAKEKYGAKTDVIITSEDSLDHSKMTEGFSLKETTRNDRTSHTNAMLAIVLPDRYGSYDYYLTHEYCGSTTHHTGSLFKIIRENKFNKRNPNGSICPKCGCFHYYGECSYIDAVKWCDFIVMPNYYINSAIQRQENKDLFDIKKEV